MTWISAPAGYGKTSLAAGYLAEKGIPTLWYQMDEGDIDLATFFYYLGLAGKKANPRKRKRLPLLTQEYQGIEIFCRRFFENLCARLTVPFFLVFDNYQKIPSDSFFHDIFRQGLEQLPAGIHALVLSRSDPPPAMTALLANNNMRSLETEDLQLTLKESKQIAARMLSMVDLEAALEEIDEALISARAVGIYFVNHALLFVAASIALLQNRLDKAKIYIDQLESLLDPAHYHGHVIYHHFAGWYCSLIGNLEQALAHAELATEIALQTGYVIPCFFSHVQLAFLLHKNGRLPAARNEFERAGILMLQIRSPLFEFMYRMLEAHFAFAENDAARGLQALRAGFFLARFHHFRNMCYWWNAEMMADLCARALASGI